jgi:hypothetical protein
LRARRPDKRASSSSACSEENMSSRFQQEISEAYSAAITLTWLAVAYYVTFFAGLFVRGFSVVTLVLFFFVLVLLVRWRLYYGRLDSDDPLFQRAKRRWKIILILWVLKLAFFVVAMAFLILGSLSYSVF